MDMSWGAPLAGSLREAYVASEDGSMMAVTSTIRIGARSAVATQVGAARAAASRRCEIGGALWW